jgi:hypothetical protein
VQVMMAQFAIRTTLTIVGLATAGLGVAVAVMQYVDYSENHWTPPPGLVASIVFLAVVFAALFVEFKHARRRVIFWAALALVGGVHILGWQIIAGFIPEIKPIWMGLVTPLETAVFVRIVDMAIDTRWRRRSQ